MNLFVIAMINDSLKYLEYRAYYMSQNSSLHIKKYFIFVLKMILVKIFMLNF